jgi:hypothetical protein
MDKSIPVEWVERIFHRLSEIFGIEFSQKIHKSDSYYQMQVTVWKNGLYGVTADEIKMVIELCRLKMVRRPPSVVEFYHYCKGHNLPPFNGKNTENEVKTIYKKLIKD